MTRHHLRIAVDLQACQTAPENQGTARYCLLLAQALARQSGTHQLQILLNGRFGERISGLRRALEGFVAPEDIVIFHTPGPTAERDPSNAWRREASLCLRDNVLSRLRPDIVHVSEHLNGFVDDAVTPIRRHDGNAVTAVGLHELITPDRPFPSAIDPATQAAHRSWFHRKVQAVRNADLILASSSMIMLDAISALQLPTERILCIGTAADPLFDVREPTSADMEFLRGLGLEKPFILSLAGTLDEGDANEMLIEAFGFLPEPVRAHHQLVIAGVLATAQQTRLETLAERFGIAPATVVFIGVGNPDAMITLYNACAVLIDLGLSSASGMTALEAMACGAAVIAANGSAAASSIENALACFVLDADGIAAKLYEVLTNEALRTQLAESGRTRAKSFSWDSIATTTLEGYAQAVERAGPRPASVLMTPLANVLAHPDSAAMVVAPAVAGSNAPSPRHTRVPRLAFISPLPPLQTGIADYSEMLLPQLARHYNIEVVTDQPIIDPPWIVSNFPVRSLSWFDRHADDFDRVLYHFGNSDFHMPMFALLERHPGIVVLHDFFLSGVLGNADPNPSEPHLFLRALYHAHGYQALVDYSRSGLNSTIWKYPCNKQVLDRATGVIVHSYHSSALAEQWYGKGIDANWHIIPLLRAVQPQIARDTACRVVGLPPTAFITCSFGMIGRTKQNIRLLHAWLSSSLANDENCYLIFCGENETRDYGAEMSRIIAESGKVNRIRITGFASATQYQAYLACADVAVQLRTLSRGETSASILDCLGNGIATIINANGAAAEIPDELLLKLPNDFEQDALSAALTLLWQNPERRADLAQRAAEHVRTLHHPALVGDRYYSAIESTINDGPDAQYREMMRDLAAITPLPPPSAQDLTDTASAIAANRDSPLQRQLLIDISAVVQVDLRTGIQRVVRSIVNVLINNPPSGCRVEPVYDAGGYYRYAREYTAEMAGTPGIGLEDLPVEFQRGDTFLGLDLYMVLAITNRAAFEDMRNRGVEVYFVVFDLLPALMPTVFPSDTSKYYCQWLEFITEMGNGLICISRSVADEAAHWIETTKPLRYGPTRIGYFHLGADIANSHPSFGLTHDAEDMLALVQRHPSVLMVGTVEPRKGHVQALDAFEVLWAHDVDMVLVIVGNEGWMVDSLVGRLRNHPQLGTKLFWLNGISDEMLLQLYEHCSVLLAASEGEGFGLPLIEAAQHGLPIIARDLPVFREVAGQHATFFASPAPADLAAALREWFLLNRDGKAPPSKGMRWLTWAESAAELQQVVEQNQWYRIIS